MNVEVINSGEDIFPIILDKLIYHGVDFSKNLVVFPGKRPSYFLIDRLKKLIKSSFVPPHVVSIDEFVDFCYEKELGIFDEKIDALSGCKIIKDILNGENLYNKKIEDSIFFFPIGIKIFSTLEELLIEGVSEQRLKHQDYWFEIVQQYSNNDESDDFQNLLSRNFSKISDIYIKFYDEIRKKNLSTRSSRYKKIAESDIKLDQYERLIFAGFFALTEWERKIFQKFMDDKRAITIFQGETAKKYALHKVYEPISFDIDKVELYECPDKLSEVFKVSDLIKKELEDKKGKESFLIISPSSDNIIPLINSLTLPMEDYNISLGYPLIRTPIFSFIKHLFDILKTMKENKVYIPDYLKFILHPYTKNIYLKGSAERARVFFHNLEEKLQKENYINYKNLEELESVDFLKDIGEQMKDEITLNEIRDFIMELHDKTIKNFLKLNDIKDLARRLKMLINFVYEKTTAKNHILFFPYCETMMLALMDLENSLFSDEKFESSFEYFEFFKKFIGLYNVPFHGVPIKDIQILGFLESRNLRFDNVYILDVNEGIIPDSEKEDEILPFDVRKKLNIPTYLEKDILFEYYLHNIISGAKRVALFYVENDKSERSRFIEKIIWEKQKKYKDLNRKYVNTVSYSIKLSPYKPKEVEKTALVKGRLLDLTYSASTIDTYYNCPLKFYYQYVLLPLERDEMVEELSFKDVGVIIHDILKEYYANKAVNYDEKRFIEVVNKCFEKYFGGSQKGKILILKHQVHEKLKKFISGYQSIVSAQSIEILDLEKEFSPVEIDIEDVGIIKIIGRVDRIEKRDDYVYVVDYKKASNEDKYKVKWDKFDISKREEWVKSFKSIQLFFYIFLLQKNKYPFSPYNASYFLLEKKDLEKIEIKLFKNDEEREENFEFINIIITRLIKEIINDPIFRPTEDLESCNSCLYKDVCWQ